MLWLVLWKIPPYHTPLRLLLPSDLYWCYIQTIYNGKEEIINNIYSIYVEPWLNDVNNPALVQECKLNIYAAVYGENWW